MFCLVRTSLGIAVVLLSLSTQVQAETISATPRSSQPNSAQLNHSKSTERSAPQSTQSEFASELNKVDSLNQPEENKLSERDRLILQYRLQQVIPAK